MKNPFKTIYFQTTNADLNTAIKELINNILDKRTCLNLNFFIETSNDLFLADYEKIKEIVHSCFPVPPLICVIPQKMCSPFAIGLECIQNEEIPDIEYKEFQDVRYLLFTSEFGNFLQIDGIKACSLTAPYNEQCTSLFAKIKAIFDIENFGVQHIVRQWNYIGDITGFENGNQHYQLFNNARSEFYNNGIFENGYPAATGISISINCVLISLMAIKPTKKTQIMPIDNTLQIPAYNYSQDVLVEGKTDHLKTTPKFERGKLITNHHSRIFFVSGTAAILNQESKHTNSAVLQTQQTIENINFLISNENFLRQSIENELYLSLSSIRVYIKNSNDFQSIKLEIEKAWPELSAIYLQAEVCREELLVEIEGIAS